MSRLEAIVALATAPTERDKQTKVGPSALGQSCEVCLALELLGEKSGIDPGLLPRYGTAFHYWMEHRAEEFVTGPDGHKYVTEMKVYVGDIEGYGPVYGSMDLFYNHGVIDYKLVGKNTRTTAKRNGPSQQYIYQVQCYGTGAVNAGLDVETVGICFFPRDSGNVKDIYLWEAKYDPAYTEAALARAALLWNHVQDNGLEGLESDPDCWACKVRAYNVIWEDNT